MRNESSYAELTLAEHHERCVRAMSRMAVEEWEETPAEPEEYGRYSTRRVHVCESDPFLQALLLDRLDILSGIAANDPRFNDIWIWANFRDLLPGFPDRVRGVMVSPPEKVLVRFDHVAAARGSRELLAVCGRAASYRREHCRLGWSALHWCAAANASHLVDSLLESGYSTGDRVEFEPKGGRLIRSPHFPLRQTPLHVSSLLRNRAVTEKLLACGGDPHVEDGAGYSPVVILLGMGQFGSAAMALASRKPEEAMLENLLVEFLTGLMHADHYRPEEASALWAMLYHETIFQWAFERWGDYSQEALRFLIETGYRYRCLDGRPHGGTHLLFLAQMLGNPHATPEWNSECLACLKLFLKLGIDVDIPTWSLGGGVPKQSPRRYFREHGMEHLLEPQ